MSDVPYNVTADILAENDTTVYTTIDYGAYYDENISFPSPCETDDLQSFGQVFLPTLYSLVFVIGSIGNGLVVCVLAKHRNQNNLTDISLLNLAVSDLLFVFTLPFYAHFSVVGEWTFGSPMCRFVSFFHYIGFFSSTFFMILVTLDRYVIIMHAHTVARYRSWSATVALSLVVWLLSVCASLPPLIFSKVTNETGGVSCGYDQDAEERHPYIPFAINILGLLLPLTVMVACYCRILPTLVNMRSAKKHRVVRLIVCIVVAFFLFWAPYNVCILMKFMRTQQTQCRSDISLRMALTVTETVAYTHCCLNPIIYAFVGQKFMKRAAHLLRKWVPVVLLPSARDMSDSSYRKSSIVSRSSDVTTTVAM
ncbi:C-C chemokine receptor type 1-like [Betta splendens]|uniref:C-C chemokine receptor type 1-like n=1 Tax=Betta splendens TaxID=158456 RepID=A0A6P7KPW9_BETSP|nr:C-C chemokine receptor type 1-like [Betta splendens]